MEGEGRGKLRPSSPGCQEPVFGHDHFVPSLFLGCPPPVLGLKHGQLWGVH